MGKKQVVYVGLSEKSDQRFWIKASDFKKVDLRKEERNEMQR